MCLKISLRVGDQFCNLILVLCLDSLCFFHLRTVSRNSVFPFFLCKGTVSLCCINTVLQSDYPVCAVRSETVDFFLNFANIIVNWLAQLHFLFSRKSLIVSFRHIHESPL